MASELTLGLELRPIPPREIMNWYSPMDKPQLLPKDLLNYARKIPKDEVNAQIMDAVKKHSLYSHSQHTNQQIFPVTGATTTTIPWGTFSSVITNYTIS